MKLMRNDEHEAAYMPNAEDDRVGGQGHREKKSTSTNAVTLIDT